MSFFHKLAGPAAANGVASESLFYCMLWLINHRGGALEKRRFFEIYPDFFADRALRAQCALYSASAPPDRARPPPDRRRTATVPPPDRSLTTPDHVPDPTATYNPISLLKHTLTRIEP